MEYCSELFFCEPSQSYAGTQSTPCLVSGQSSRYTKLRCFSHAFEYMHGKGLLWNTAKTLQSKHPLPASTSFPLPPTPSPTGNKSSSNRQVPSLCLVPQVFLGNSGTSVARGNLSATALVPSWNRAGMALELHSPISWGQLGQQQWGRVGMEGEGACC